MERQILPELKLSYKRNPSAPAPAQPRAAPQAASVADVHAALARLLGTAGATDGFPGPANAAMQVSPATRGFVQSLTGLQLPGADAMATAEGLANVIRDLKAAPQSAALPGVDALTIDIVAMLFDFVFEDRQIPAAVKAAARAPADPDAQGGAARPRLLLLARPSRAAAARSPGARRHRPGRDERARGAPRVAKLEEVVGRVLAEFDDDIALFATLAAEMEAFLGRQDEAEDAIARAHRPARGGARTARDRPRRRGGGGGRAGSPRATGFRSRCASCSRTPGCARSRASMSQQGEGSGPWIAMLTTVDELLWSVEPKVRAEDRRRLVAGIPALIRSLHEGLARAGVEEAVREAFLGALVDCHADAVKSGLKGTALSGRHAARPPAPERPLAAPTLEREMVPAGDIHVEEIRLRSPRGQPAVRNVFTRTGIWTNVQRFTWVEFRREGGQLLRARLTWISPAKGVYLFTNSEASAAISITPEALAEQMRRGEARIVDDAPLVDRAVDAMLANLRERAA